MIKNIILRTGLSRKALAELLFKGHKHPYQALRYVEQGNRELKESEINIIRGLCGEYPVTEPVARGTWKAKNTYTGFSFMRDGYILTYYEGIANVVTQSGAVVATGLRVDPKIQISDLFINIDKKIEEYEASKD